MRGQPIQSTWPNERMLWNIFIAALCKTPEKTLIGNLMEVVLFIHGCGCLLDTVLTHFLQSNFFYKPQITKLCTFQISFGTWPDETPSIASVKGFFRGEMFENWSRESNMSRFLVPVGPKNPSSASAWITTELQIHVKCSFSFPQEGFFYTESEVEKQYFERKSNKHRI